LCRRTVNRVRTDETCVQVRKLDHVALRRVDPESAATWYASVLGLQRRFEDAFGDASPVTVGVGECSISFFPGEAASFEHVAFEVRADALELVAAQLRDRGVEHHRSDHGIARSLYLTDPDGGIVELTAYIEETTPMTTDPKIVVTQLVEEMFNRHDLDVADRYVAVDCVDHSGFPGQPAGLAGMKARWSMLFEAFPDFKIVVDDLVADGEKVSMRATGRGTQQGAFFGIPPTGNAVEFTEINISRIVDGKMTEHWAERSNLAVLQQIGAISF